MAVLGDFVHDTLKEELVKRGYTIDSESDACYEYTKEHNACNGCHCLEGCDLLTSAMIEAAMSGFIFDEDESYDSKKEFMAEIVERLVSLEE